MSYVPIVEEGKIFEDQSPALLARVLAGDGSYLVQADVNTVKYEVWDLDASPAAKVTGGTLSKASVIFDTLELDYHWSEEVDQTGYNVRWVCPGTNFPTAGKTYRVTIMITDTGGNIIPLPFEIETEKTYYTDGS